MIDTAKFLEDLSGRFARPYTNALTDLLVAIVRGNRAQTEDARNALNATMLETLGVAEVLGATQILQAAAPVLRSEGIALRADWGSLVVFESDPIQKILPRVSLAEAGQDMIDRAPRTIKQAAERTWRRISQMYSKGHVVAFVRSAEQAVTERARSLIVEALEQGIPESEAGRGIKMAVDEIRKKTQAWTESYSRMAFRTNVNTAVTAGRFRQVQDPDVRKVIPAFRHTTSGDTDVRHNHKPDGIILRVDNPLWAKISPPLGWSCRCRLDNVTLPMLRRMGRLNPDGSVRESSVPSTLEPDEGFRHGGRPDLFLLNEVGT